ncbi:MAG: cache domain-containing protein, partial [Acetivibrionales bacterium]
MRLKSRITLYFVLMVMLPSIAVSLVIYMHTRSLMVQASYEASLTRISKENDYIGYCLGELELAIDSSVSSISAQQLIQMLRTPNEESNEDMLAVVAASCLSPAQWKSLSAIYVTDPEGIRASYGPEADKAVISDPSSRRWFTDALDNGGKVLMLGTVQRFYAEGESRLVFSAAKSISHGDVRAVVLFDFNHSLLTDFLRDPVRDPASDRQPGNAERLILDKDGYVLYSRDEGMLTAKASEAILARISDKQQDFSRIRYNDSDYYMAYMKYSEFNWIFIDLVPASSVTGRLWLRSPLLITSLA